MNEQQNESHHISSLSELIVAIPTNIRECLNCQYKCLDEDDDKDHLHRILQAMKTPTRVTTCRVNLLLSTADEVLEDLHRFLADFVRGKGNDVCGGGGDDAFISHQVIFEARPHSVLHDVIEIIVAKEFSDVSSLDKFTRAPCKGKEDISSLPFRNNSKFPLDFKVVICDRFCGEAVLRGSDIFIRGVLAADRNVEIGDMVCVYAHVDQSVVRRGLNVDKYYGHCVFLGLGKVTCSRAQMFNQYKGLAVKMLNGVLNSTTNGKRYSTRAGALCPPMNDILPNKMMLQNLPSIVVGHVLNPQPHDRIIDLCCAPGGKTSHVASLVNNNALIIACDKSRKKMIAVKDFFQRMGATCITPIAMDSTKSVLDGPWMSVKDILSSASQSETDGLLNIRGFYPSSFDRIILDPPVSVLTCL